MRRTERSWNGWNGRMPPRRSGEPSVRLRSMSTTVATAIPAGRRPEPRKPPRHGKRRRDRSRLLRRPRPAEGEPAAPEFRTLLEVDDHACLTAVGVAEVVEHLVRRSGASEDDAALDLAQLGPAEGIVVDTAVDLRSGLLRARRYHRKNGAVSPADWVAVEAARDDDAPLASADPTCSTSSEMRTSESSRCVTAPAIPGPIEVGWAAPRLSGG
jgi:hypothetical protein